MGGHSYNQENRSFRSADFQKKSASEIFSNRLHDSMKPYGVTIRESRDSELHPYSIPIIIALDVTGSMGRIPEMLVKEGLPHIISGLVEAGIADPQILFLAIGDHITDSAPLQISQFESGDEELDMWLTRVWLEGGGGGNKGESYGLAHYFAANHTVTDHWEKRNKKGFLFTVGDERNHPNYPGSFIKDMMGVSESSSLSNEDLIKSASEKWELFHILPNIVSDNSDEQWNALLPERVLNVPIANIPSVITKTIVNTVGNYLQTVSKQEPVSKPGENKTFL